MDDLPVFVDTISVAQSLALYIHRACTCMLYFLEGSSLISGPMLCFSDFTRYVSKRESLKYNY
jgi:hypothetical protein